MWSCWFRHGLASSGGCDLVGSKEHGVIGSVLLVQEGVALSIGLNFLEMVSGTIITAPTCHAPIDRPCP